MTGFLYCLLLLHLGLEAKASGSTSASAPSCDKTRVALKTRGLGPEDLRSLPKHYNPSCDGPETPTPCCPEDVRSKLVAWTSAHFRASLDRAIREAFRSHGDQANAIEDLVDRLLKDGPRAAERVLQAEGGFLSERRRRVLDDLFEDLGRLDDQDAGTLRQQTRAFFMNLYERMLQEIQSRAPNCTLRSETVGALVFEPPEEVVSVAHSVRTLRTLVLALRTGHSVAGNVSGPKITSECLSALYRMHACPMCVGRPEVKPCKNFCLDVMDLCLSDYGELNDSWRRFADRTIRLIDQIFGPAIDQDLLNLDRSVGTELTHFLDQVKQTHFDACGVPAWKGTPQNPEESLDDEEKILQIGSDLKKMATEAKELVKLTKGFWANLPFVMCSNFTNYNPNLELFFDTDDAESLGCWTGTTVGKSNTTTEWRSKLEDEPRSRLVHDQILHLEKFCIQYELNHGERSSEKQKREQDDDEEGSGETDAGDDEDYVDGSGSTPSYESPTAPPYQTTTTMPEKPILNSSNSLSGAFLTLFLMIFSVLLW